MIMSDPADCGWLAEGRVERRAAESVCLSLHSATQRQKLNSFNRFRLSVFY